MRNTIAVTTDAGSRILPIVTEPEPASVVLTSGEFGTAWQRYFTDLLWHRVGGTGRGRTWDELMSMRSLVLVYDAAPRDDRERF